MSNLENNQLDAIENIIIFAGLRIKTIDLHPELDLMTICLNTQIVLSQRISSYKLLKYAENHKLMQHELIGGGTGVHWPHLDEDLSLKGFLQDELGKVVKGNGTNPIAA